MLLALKDYGVSYLLGREGVYEIAGRLVLLLIKLHLGSKALDCFCMILQYICKGFGFAFLLYFPLRLGGFLGRFGVYV